MSLTKFATAATAALLLSAGSASAAITLSNGEAGGVAVHSTSGLAGDSVVGTIGPGGEAVTLSTTGDTITTSGGGASTYSGPFDDFLISFLTGKTKVGFNLEFYNPPGRDPTLTTGLAVYVNGVLVGTRPDPLAAPQKYFVTATDGDVINNVLLVFAPNVIGSVKQIRVTGAAPPMDGVPEPATWAMMIMGFGAAGSVLRRRKLALARI